MDILNEGVLIPREKIPDQIYGVTLSEDDKERLVYGHWSGILKNANIDGETNDLKILFSYNSDGQIEININKKDENIFFPEEILGASIGENEKNQLLNSKTLGPYTFEGETFYLAIDKELNKIIFKPENDEKEISPLSINLIQMLEINPLHTKEFKKMVIAKMEHLRKNRFAKGLYFPYNDPVLCVKGQTIHEYPDGKKFLVFFNPNDNSYSTLKEL